MAGVAGPDRGRVDVELDVVDRLGVRDGDPVLDTATARKRGGKKKPHREKGNPRKERAMGPAVDRRRERARVRVSQTCAAPGLARAGGGQSTFADIEEAQCQGSRQVTVTKKELEMPMRAPDEMKESRIVSINRSLRHAPLGEA